MLWSHRLLIQYSKTVDEGSIQSPVGTNFVINLDGTVDDGDSTSEYNASKTYYPHILSLVGANTLLEQNISIETDTLTENGAETEDSTKTLIRPTTGSRVLKKTGQTKSYDESGAKAVPISSVKDDGFYQAGVVPHYTRDNENEIVTDHITGLEWQDDVETGTVTMQWLTDQNYDICGNDNNDPACYDTSGNTATEYCDVLTLGGFEDWRLPTIDELMYIANRSKRGPAIDTSYFENVVSIRYWSSTTVVAYSNSAWYLNFNEGSGSWLDKSNSFYVRCVRARQ